MNGRVRSLSMTVPITSDCIRLLMPDRPCSHSINAPLHRWNTWCAYIYNFTLACHRSVSFPIELSSGKNIHHTRRQCRVGNSSSSPAGVVRSFTLSIELMIILCLSCAYLSWYLLPRNRIVILHACAMRLYNRNWSKISGWYFRGGFIWLICMPFDEFGSLRVFYRSGGNSV